MNDFTKEELEDLYRAVDLCGLYGYEVNLENILPKIQSMIDTYCGYESEHLRQEIESNETGRGPGGFGSTGS